jgi:hypothetical protein
MFYIVCGAAWCLYCLLFQILDYRCIKSVLKTSISRTKDGKKSESEVAMCDRMQMYNIMDKFSDRFV